MSRINNIAKQLILLAIVLIGWLSYGFAQNTYDLPYLGSWHKYRVPMGNVLNTPSWELGINAGAPFSLTNNMNESGDGEVWVRYGTENITGTDYAYIEIKFIDPRFDVADVATIIYSETNAATGNCIAKRSFAATVQTNDFNLTIVNNGNTCNSYSGVGAWENGHGTISDYDLSSTIDFQVQINKPSTLRATSWQFSGTVSITSGSPDNVLTGPDITIGGVNTTSLNASNGATWSVNSITGTSFVIDVSVANPDFAYTTDIVTFNIEVQGDVTSTFTVQLQLDDGTIVTGTNYFSVTEDGKGLTPRTLGRTISGIPNTSVIY